MNQKEKTSLKITEQCRKIKLRDVALGAMFFIAGLVMALLPAIVDGRIRLW